MSPQRYRRQRQGVRERVVVERFDRPDGLALERKHEFLVALDESGLVLQKHERLGVPVQEERRGEGYLAGDRGRFISGRRGGSTGKGG